jgi:hypothetical protein
MNPAIHPGEKKFRRRPVIYEEKDIYAEKDIYEEAGHLW